MPSCIGEARSPLGVTSSWPHRLSVGPISRRNVGKGFVCLFYIPLIFTDVELVIFVVSIVDKQVYIVVPYCNITVSIVDKISIRVRKLCLNVVSW
jgi:hypothetical protein